MGNQMSAEVEEGGYPQKEFNCEVNWGEGDYFDLLGLPDEMIERIFCFLDVEDGMRMRMNKRLNKIESKSKYNMKRVVLYKEPTDGDTHVTIENRQYPLNFLVRIAQNASIGELDVYLLSSDEINSKFIDLIRELENIRKMVVNIQGDDNGQFNEIMSDSLFLDLTGRCKNLYLKFWAAPYIHLNNISSEAFHKMYKNMNDGSTSLRKLTITAHIDLEKLNAFLNVLGIAYRNERVITNRDVEAYKDRDTSFGADFHVNIFDGFFHILFCDYGFGRGYSNFNIELRENVDSLNCAKKNTVHIGMKRARMDVYLE